MKNIKILKNRKYKKYVVGIGWVLSFAFLI